MTIFNIKIATNSFIIIILSIITIFNAQAQNELETLNNNDLLTMNEMLSADENVNNLNGLENSETAVLKMQSILTCPKCQHQTTEVMQENACKVFHKCDACNNMVKPKEKECCVFCSYGSVKCPSKQKIELTNDNNAL
ncbi:MAG: GDCCVxC domain-containing (seleno)protein [Chitinophagales bacterium]